ncbi:MAG: cation-translocating P-type ATPase [Candidatus Levybacteria bacterium]|nr:cation-translocating P-type ATPase [Candidatus Levybacteria bacterium]
MNQGLSSSQAQEKLKNFGKNEINVASSFTALSIFLSQFKNILAGILFLAAIFSLIIGHVIDSAFISAVLILNAIFGFIQEYRAEKSLEKLKEYVRLTTRVIRDGKETQIPSSEIAPGDIVIISEGDRIPADGNLVAKSEVEVDESILTGESLPVEKKHGEELLSGTLVTRGGGHLLVMKTGMQTRFGQIAQTLSAVNADTTPLQKKLNSLAKIISALIMLASLLLIPLGLLQNQSITFVLLLAVSIAVAAIPQGLPAVITIALAIGTGRMAKNNAIVRKMPAVETLGAIQILLVDKTGTLTENAMRVKKHWVPSKDSLDHLLKACVFGNTASLIKKAGTNEVDIVGDKTDGSLLLWAKEQLSDIDSIKNSGSIVDEYTFDNDRKTITTVWKDKSKKYVFVRGAPEAVLKRTTLNEKERKESLEQFETFAKEGLRVIGFASKIETHDLRSREHVENNLTFSGIVGIYDPPRKEVKHSIEQAKRAGIKTIMVTGDSELTAMAIGKEIGLIDHDQDVVTGDELHKMKDDELEKVIIKTNIFARTQPEDKLRLAETFKKLGFVIGVTGDGVNDALALKRADVGVAMGKSGTDVAKEASDIILTDDNFSTLVRATEEGRTIYNNILKAITYLLTGNLSELSLIFFASILGITSPLLPTQILWVNLVTDGVPALALASDNKDHSVLTKKPRKANSPILSKRRLLFIGTVGLSLSLFILFVFKTLIDNGNSETLSRTIVFNMLIVSHMGLAFLVRGKSMFKINKFLILGVLGILTLQAIITFNPVFQNIFKLGF